MATMRLIGKAAMAVAIGVCLLAGAAAQRPGAFSASRDDLRIQYSTATTTDRVSRLNRELQQGTVELTFAPAGGYLKSLLDALKVPVSSQTLVFSQTSAQAAHIDPRNPRAVFFDDAVAVGWVRGGGHLEIAAHDPRQGVIFYTLEQQASARPQLKRDNSCLQCHLSWDTLAVPGMLTISTFPMSSDKNAYASGVVVNHETPFEQRWGGWYVTGDAMPSRHLGNVPVVQSDAQLARPPAPPPRLRSIETQFDTAGYLSTFSDVVALTVLGHQAHMTNLLTRVGWEARIAAAPASGAIAPRRGEAPARPPLDEAATALVDYLLFVDEAVWPQPIRGTSGFAETFSSSGPRDARGRSLRDLDLQRRLLRYPCSYMVYSPAFDALPAAATRLVYERLWQVLSGRDRSPQYRHLSLPDRRAIVEILEETKANLPSYFRSASLG
jgi:hypothetical protein